jgi:RNA polymerase sigma-70 factor, ECF subfamily
VSSGGVLDIRQEGTVTAGAPDGKAERVLLARLRRGDPEAFELLVREHQDRIYDFCVRMLGDREEAHDLVQEIFVSVHQNVARFREDARLSTWLFRISKNQCINRLKYLKRRGRGRSDEYGDVGEDVLLGAMGAPPTPEVALESARERARVQWAISQLEPDARMLVALRDIEGLSYEEIIEITELPEGTVKSRLHRAREKLADLLGRLEE